MLNKYSSAVMDETDLEGALTGFVIVVPMEPGKAEWKECNCMFWLRWCWPWPPAHNALHKIRFLALSGKDVLGKDDTAELEIQIKLNKEYKILSIQDSGVGMTKEDLIKNLGTIFKIWTFRYVWESKADGPFAIPEDTWNEPLGCGTDMNSDLLLLPVSTGSCNSDLLLLLPGALARLASGAPALEPGHGKVCTDQVNAQV
ncbi:hypothetical protein QYE76_008810 [Lolium multiflorum]|uniref:Uncharacterized protein n=1 Tax=Lolium multiflorum TaxID=4521 RepID=A0AAD8TU52_LOLMU|nr:hypothetical protein QYE76_008808 [Lolium multiflorum]KAK1692113.1 hypothetical protein QYE76_008810 [Lolium multiflorum]